MSFFSKRCFRINTFQMNSRWMFLQQLWSQSSQNDPCLSCCFAIGGVSELGEFQSFTEFQKKPSRGVVRKRCSENMLQICRRTPMPNCDFNKVAKQRSEITLRHGCSPVNFLHIFRTSFTKNTSGRLLLQFLCWWKFRFSRIITDCKHSLI